MFKKTSFVIIFLFILLNFQFQAVTPSISNKSNQDVSVSLPSTQSSLSHTVLNITTTNGTIEDWDSFYTPEFYLHFGDILMLNLTIKPLDDPNSDVIVYINKPLQSVKLIEAQNYSTYFFPAYGIDSEGNYSYKVYNPGVYKGGDRIEVMATVTMITNSAPTLTVVQNQYINTSFNFNSWHPIDLNNDSLTYDLYYEYGGGPYNQGNPTTIVINTTNPNKFLKAALENELFDSGNLIRVVLHDYFSVLNLKFSSYAFYDIKINFEKGGPQIAEYPKNITINSGKADAVLTWKAFDWYASIYKVFKDNSLVNTSSWNANVENTYPLGKLDVGKYNYTFVIYNMCNNSVTVTAIVTVKNKSLFDIYGFEFLSILAIPVLIFIKRRQKQP